MSWRGTAYRSVRPLLFAVDPESIHHATLRALSVAGSFGIGRALCAFASGASTAGGARQPVELMGLTFRNRIGVGAGFDKDGVAVLGWAALGLGFMELGTVTPRPQAGQPRPRLFRLPEDEALINRMGFNNLGADALARRVAEARPRLPDGFVIGVNVGPNADTPAERAIDDYVSAARTVADVADYVAINVSSPNTPRLRDLQAPSRLADLVSAVHDAAPHQPLVVKLSPDLGAAELDALIEVMTASPANGVILSNTTLDRAGLRSNRAGEVGGLSGRPLRERTRATVARVRSLAPRLAIIGSGGVASGADASALREAGADLVQLWTGMIYAGPGLIGETVGG
jgi:dihydroorotate dehydrogenase